MSNEGKIGLKYIVVNEAGMNKPLLILKGESLWPRGNAYPKESVFALIDTAME